MYGIGRSPQTPASRTCSTTCWSIQVRERRRHEPSAAAWRDGIRQRHHPEALAHAIARAASAEIRLLVVNNPGCGAEQRAQNLGIACAVVDHRGCDTREALDRELVRRFQAAEVEAVVMAGWMRIVTAELIQAFPGRLLNIHPSLLPSFRGLDGVGQALQAGVRISGCTVHLVTEDLDAGPVIMQAAVPVHAEDHDSLVCTQQQEHRILSGR